MFSSTSIVGNDGKVSSSLFTNGINKRFWKLVSLVLVVSETLWEVKA
jgi:hypothetical protein